VNSKAPRLRRWRRHLQGNQDRNRPACAVELICYDTPELRTLVRCRPHQRDARVVKIKVAALEPGRHSFRWPEIHHVDRARANQLRKALATGCFQPMWPSGQHAAHQLFLEFCGRHVENGFKYTVFDELLHRLAANARSVKTRTS
jgi:hypothetical protein